MVNCAASIWTPDCVIDTSTLQSAQNSGCHAMSSVPQPHRDSRGVAVKQHYSILSRQYMRRFHTPKHPSNDIDKAPPVTPRNIKKVLITTYSEIITKVPPDTDAVRHVFQYYLNSLDLGTKLPPVQNSEANLP